MPDFDTNDDSLRLSDSGKDEPVDLPKLRPRFTPRARALAHGRCFASSGDSAARLQTRLATRRWGAVRRTCPSAATPSRRRRLWTTCHGRAPGSPS